MNRRERREAMRDDATPIPAASEIQIQQPGAVDLSALPELYCGRATRRIAVAHGTQMVVDKPEHGIFWTCRCGARGDNFNPKLHEAVTRQGVKVPVDCPRCGLKAVLVERKVALVSDGEATAMIRKMVTQQTAR